MKRFLLFVFTILSFMAVVSCKAPTTSDKLTVAVSIVPQATFIEKIAGDLVQVITIIPPGFSPANYEPTAKTMEDLENASVYFAIGVPAEATTILPNLTGIPTIHLETIVAEHYADRMFGVDSRDPHIWLSIKRVIVMVEAMTEELSSIDPGNASVYSSNAQAFIHELQNIDALLQLSFANVSNTDFIVFHPSYGYFAEDYGLNMVSLEEDGKEATPQHLQSVIDFALANNITTVFYQAEIDSSQVAAFAEEIHGDMVMLDPLSADYLNNLLDMATHILEALQ